MSGHSKWATIKHKKAATDAKRGALFNKLIREITVAAKNGADLEMNPTLKSAVYRAKAGNMPLETIKRAIERGAGAGSGENFEHVVYEGYGPAGTAILVECLTDNRNRTFPELRTIFGKGGGNLGEAGSVAWKFKQRGEIQFSLDKRTEDAVMELVMDAGADDFSIEANDNIVYAYSDPSDTHTVRQALENKKVNVIDARLIFMATDNIQITDQKDAEKIMKLMSNLEDHDDVQNVFSDFDMSAELMESFS